MGTMRVLQIRDESEGDKRIPMSQDEQSGLGVQVMARAAANYPVLQLPRGL